MLYSTTYVKQDKTLFVQRKGHHKRLVNSKILLYKKKIAIVSLAKIRNYVM